MTLLSVIAAHLDLLIAIASHKIDILAAVAAHKAGAVLAANSPDPRPYDIDMKTPPFARPLETVGGWIKWTAYFADGVLVLAVGLKIGKSYVNGGDVPMSLLGYPVTLTIIIVAGPKVIHVLVVAST